MGGSFVAVPSLRVPLRTAAHAAAWSPFLISIGDSLRGGWHAVGDGALIALRSWATFSRHLPLVGQPIVLHPGAHDLGPLEDWLLAIPVHADAERGLVWGAALLCLAAVSVTIEAAWSVAGPAGGLTASGLILALVAWMPAIAVRPYWNPYFGALSFLAAVTASWAVMSGRRRWWPALVVSASIAAQSHLMFALASASLVLLVLVVITADVIRSRTGYWCLIGGLFAGEICWLAPLDQQFSSSPGNMSVLLHAESAGPHAGIAFGLKALAAFTEPPPLWWQPHLGFRLDLYPVITARPAWFALAVLAIMAAIVPVAWYWLRSRSLAGLAAADLIVSTAAVITFADLPAASADLSRLYYLILVLFPAGVLTWLIVGTATVLTVRKLLASRAAAMRLIPGTAWAATAALVVLASVLGWAQVSGYPGAGQSADQVATARPVIDRALPSGREVAVLVVAGSASVRYQVGMGLLWALTVQGYDPVTGQPRLARRLPQVIVLISGRKVLVKVSSGGGARAS